MAGTVTCHVYQSRAAVSPEAISFFTPWYVMGIGVSPLMLTETVVLMLIAVAWSTKWSTDSYVSPFCG